MKQEVSPMSQGKTLILALAAAALAGCASAGAGPVEDATGVQETAATRSATVHLVQAGMQEGEAATAEYQEAHTEAMRAIAETPENPKAYLVAGQAAVGLQDWVQADTMFDRALSLNPGYSDQIEAEREAGWVVSYNLGAEALNDGDLDRAAEMFQAADRLYQGRPEARIGLGSLYVNQGDQEAAAESYLGALEILQQDAPEGLSEEQVESWRQTRQIAALNAAELLGQTGQFTRAADVLESYIRDYGSDLDPATTRRARTALAGFYAQAGEAEKAEALYSEILGQEDLTEDEYFQAAVGFFNTGDFGRAAESFRMAAEMNPYSRDARLNLVQALYSQALELEKEEAAPERDAQLTEIYEEIQEVGSDVREVDPLNRNLMSFVLRSFRSLADIDPTSAARLNQRAQTMVREYQNQPFELSDVRVDMINDTEARISGTLTNLNATAGSTGTAAFRARERAGCGGGIDHDRGRGAGRGGERVLHRDDGGAGRRVRRLALSAGAVETRHQPLERVERGGRGLSVRAPLVLSSDVYGSCTPARRQSIHPRKRTHDRMHGVRRADRRRARQLSQLRERPAGEDASL